MISENLAASNRRKPEKPDVRLQRLKKFTFFMGIV
jgi:hypothetical protein